MLGRSRKSLYAGAVLLFLSLAPAWAGDVTVRLQGNYTVTSGTTRITIPTSWMQEGHAYTLTSAPVSGNVTAYSNPYLQSVVYVDGSTTRRIVHQSRHTPDLGEQVHLQKDMWNTGENKAEFWARCETASCYMKLTVYEREEGTFDRKTFYRNGVEYRVIDGQYSLYKDFYHPTEKNGDYGLQVDYEADRYIYLYRDDNFSTSGVNALSFWIRSSGSIDEDDLTIALTTGNHSLITGWLPLSDYVEIEASHTWYRVLIPLSHLNPSGSSIRGLAIQSDTPGLVYFDDVELISHKLLWPLEGGFNPNLISTPFGDDWVDSCNGLIKKHAGIDVPAAIGAVVKSSMKGTVRKVLLDAPWAQGVVIEDETGTFTVVYWHINSNLWEGATVNKGDPIGTIADISSVTTPHLHFGYRRGPYNSTHSRVGSLPQTTCGGYSAYPENFINPEALDFDSW